MELEVVEGNIAELEVDAVANAANDQLWMGARARAYEPAGLEGVVFAVFGRKAEEAFRAALAEGPE